MDHRMRRFGLAFSLVAVSFSMASSALPAADAANGERLARRWCASCHVVARDQRSPTAEAAPFSSIAKFPNFNAGQLALYLLTPHPKMPDMDLSRAEAADLVAYIASMK
jgi:mono/diheme cytochrome c family protein